VKYQKTTITVTALITLIFCAISCSSPGGGGNEKEDITITTTTLPDGVENNVYPTTTLQATEGNAANYLWSVSEGSLPAGLLLSLGGELSGKLESDTEGVYTFTVKVTDGANNPGSKQFTIVISVIGVDPESLPAAQRNAVYSQIITASNGTDPYTFSIIDGVLPAGLSLATISDTKAEISGTPTDFETCDFTIRIEDSSGPPSFYVDKDYSISVVSDVPVQVDTVSCADGFVTAAYSETLAASGGQGTYVWSIEDGELPGGLSLNDATGEISGTATTDGTFNFTVRATDTVETSNYGEKALSIHIYEQVNITTTACDDGMQGSAYYFELDAEGGSGPIAWSLVDGSLPAGLSLNSGSGAISGTPTGMGSSTFTVRAVDDNEAGNYDEEEFSIDITEAVEINTVALPSVGANKSYNETLSVSGGSGSYTWSVDSGALPLDVTLNSSSGVISGYPARPGTYNFTVKCEDSANSANFDTQALSIGVTNLEWTIMIYLDGDNNLDEYAFSDINEMEAADLRGYGIKVIALMDGAAGYYTGTSAFENTRLYEVLYDSAGDSTATGIVSRRLGSTELGLTDTGSEELNMGTPATASNFIDFCTDKYTADNYAFVFWNHGSGWRSTVPQIKKSIRDFTALDPSRIISDNSIPHKPSVSTTSGYKAVCEDMNPSDILYTQEVGTAVSGKGLDVIGFDLCYGGMMEIAYEIRNHASIMIGSEETEPLDGWEYDDILNTFKATTRTAEDLYTAVIDAYETRYTATAGMTLSAIDLTEINDLMSALNTFSDALYSAATTNTIRDELLVLIYFDAEDYYQIPGDSNLDIYDMAFEVSNQTGYADAEAAALMNAVDDAVLDEWHHATGNPDSHGIALHFVYDDGANYGHNIAYVKASGAAYPLAFVADSTWVIDGTNAPIYTGLLYRLWYERD